jgi:pimeloyl-ACP methyl ester carboxylesterase
VDFRNPDRPPLLFIAGGADNIMPPSVNRSNAQHYKGEGTMTEYIEVPGRSHWTCAEPGWEQIADTALDRALRHAG